uniref:DB domain-containing protein n=1 Tax=Rhabditophanes sp. KR3021 TaxID=114890 RepID=A0AC35UHN1_9BILA
MKSIALLALIVASTCIYAQDEPKFTTAPQCRCSDIDQCTTEIQKRTLTCKKETKCTSLLSKIGNADKIISCLDKENDFAIQMEGCVKKKIGALGCSNDAHPGNLTIPLIPVIQSEDGPIENISDDSLIIAPAMPPTQGPQELGQFLMCVEQCTMAEAVNIVPTNNRAKRSPVSCAFLMRCALAPPDETVNTAFGECEKELKINPKLRMKESCECLKDAGIKSIKCEA